MCHEFMRGRCSDAQDGDSYCEKGWHINEKQYREEKEATKRTLPSRYADDRSVNKRHRNGSTTESAANGTEKKKWVVLQIYLFRLGFYDFTSSDKSLPHPHEIEMAYENAMEQELPEEEKERKEEAFQQIMRTINGHDDDEESDLDHNTQ